MPVTAEYPVIENGCKGCNACKNACPAGAITGNDFNVEKGREHIFNAEKCSKNMKTYQNVGRGAVCGICIKVCPYNKL